MLTVIKDGKFTGTQYEEDKPEYRAHHSQYGEICVWYPVKLEPLPNPIPQIFIPVWPPVPEGLIDRGVLTLEMNDLLSYLAATDYLVVRNMETGKEMPQEAKQKRQEARDRISQIRIELGE
jgi:hypothetical protein